MPLAHGWKLIGEPALSKQVIDEFIEPAVRAVPSAIAARLKPCRISLAPTLQGGSQVASAWTETADALDIAVATADTEPHDVALELLVCIGQALWTKISRSESIGWLDLLRKEIEAGVEGDIDEDTFERKRRLLASRASARSRRRLEDYAGAAFAATVAEYIHSLWHDVTVREGPEHLPAAYVRARFEFLARLFPPEPGYSLFA